MLLDTVSYKSLSPIYKLTLNFFTKPYVANIGNFC